jgi:hypothetical protein
VLSPKEDVPLPHEVLEENVWVPPVASVTLIMNE